MSTRFESILFPQAASATAVDDAALVADLHLDRVLAAMTAGREEYELDRFFYSPLRDADAVAYRHEVLRDLEAAAVRDAVGTFAEEMRRSRAFLALARTQHYRSERERWLLDAAAIYCDAVTALTRKLVESPLGSRGLLGVRDYLLGYVGSEGFRVLAAAARAALDGLARVRYTVRIKGARVTVGRYEGEPDYGAEVEGTFARFRQGAVESHLVSMRGSGSMDHVQARIVQLVARLYPDELGALEAFCARHGDFLDAPIVRFDREVQFYLGYLELVERLRAAGLPFCYPRVSTRSSEGPRGLSAEETFELALALELVPKGCAVVCNDVRLQEPERIVVVTGPNNGGKTTFARTFGELHYLASLGLPVPGHRVRLTLPDRIYTHFEREEHIATLRGKLEVELVRIHAILERATADSVIVMNESFGSTTSYDALVLGTEVLGRILALGSLGVYVTFVDELASLGEATVSMVSQVVPEDPARRTFKLARQPADGLAYAWAIAEKYALTYERLRERIAA